jgi:hypothetical protein
MRIPSALALIVALAGSAHGPTASAEAHAPAYRLIVNSSNPTTVVSRQFLAEAFLKKTTGWPDGGLIRPTDLAPASPVRRQFSEEVLHRSVEEVKGYWQQRIFSGRDVPPPEFDSDDDAIKYVLKYDGAIGYVAGGTDLKGTKVLSVQ